MNNRTVIALFTAALVSINSLYSMQRVAPRPTQKSLYQPAEFVTGIMLLPAVIAANKQLNSNCSRAIGLNIVADIIRALNTSLSLYNNQSDGFYYKTTWLGHDILSLIKNTYRLFAHSPNTDQGDLELGRIERTLRILILPALESLSATLRAHYAHNKQDFYTSECIISLGSLSRLISDCIATQDRRKKVYLIAVIGHILLSIKQLLKPKKNKSKKINPTKKLPKKKNPKTLKKNNPQPKHQPKAPSKKTTTTKDPNEDQFIAIMEYFETSPMIYHLPKRGSYCPTYFITSKISHTKAMLEQASKLLRLETTFEKHNHQKRLLAIEQKLKKHIQVLENFPTTD